MRILAVLAAAACVLGAFLLGRNLTPAPGPEPEPRGQISNLPSVPFHDLRSEPSPRPTWDSPWQGLLAFSPRGDFAPDRDYLSMHPPVARRAYEPFEGNDPWRACWGGCGGSVKWKVVDWNVVGWTGLALN